LASPPIRYAITCNLWHLAAKSPTGFKQQPTQETKPSTTKDLNIPKRPHLQYANKTPVSTIAP
jgi:hypothetical protein